MGSYLEITFRVTDPNGGKISYSLGAAAPEGLILNPMTGKLHGIPMVEGDYPITVIAEDEQGLTTSTSFVMEVFRPIGFWTFHPPTLGPLSDYDVTIGTYNRRVLTATDYDNSAFYLHAEGLPPGLRVDPTDQEIYGTPTGPAGTYIVTVVMRDPDNLVDTGMFTITVKEP